MTLTVLPERDQLGLRQGRLLIDGEWVDAADGRTRTHRHPGTGEEVGSFAIAGAADVDRAVTAARRAFDEGPWPTMPTTQRTRILLRAVELLREHADELIRYQALDNGIPVRFSGGVYPLGGEIVADTFEHHAGWIDKLTGETYPHHSGSDSLVMTLREPVGVVGAVIPWNAPLMLTAAKLAPALAAGCTVVLKPAEDATFCVLRICELLQEAGLPPGVLNVVPGEGPETGEALITHPGVDKLTFTGSRAVGKRVMNAAAEGIKRVTLELGGKSPHIVFDDCGDLDMTAAKLMGMVALGVSGQGCVCHTRALVQRGIYDELVDKCATWAAAPTQGSPFADATTCSPIINEKQLNRVLSYIDKGTSEGARLVAGGERLNGELSAGNWVAPTLFADVDNSLTIAQEEIFGPVLAMTPFDDEDEAIQIANDVEYGLGASVLTTDVRRAVRLAKAVKAGTFGINMYSVFPHSPFGGYKASGIGREGGRPGIEEFTELKTVYVAMTDAPI